MEMSVDRFKEVNQNAKTVMSEQAKVGRKLKLRLWDQAGKRSSRGAVMIVHVHVLSGWLASSYPMIRRAFL